MTPKTTQLRVCKWFIDRGFRLYPGKLKSINGEKKFHPDYPTGFKGITNPDDLDTYKESPCWLGKSNEWCILDDDTGKDIVKKHLDKLPKPALIIATGTPDRYHYYYRTVSYTHLTLPTKRIV